MAPITDLRAQVLNAQTLSNFGMADDEPEIFTAQALDAVQGINGLVATNGTQVGIAVSNLVEFSTQLTQLANSAQDVLAHERPEYQRRDQKHRGHFRHAETDVRRLASRQRLGRNRFAK